LPTAVVCCWFLPVAGCSMLLSNQFNRTLFAGGPKKNIIEGKQQSGNEKNQREKRKCNEIYFQARVKNVVEL